jgi:hypothetical protein
MGVGGTKGQKGDPGLRGRRGKPGHAHTCPLGPDGLPAADCLKRSNHHRDEEDLDDADDE